jgi:hypothetical protein
MRPAIECLEFKQLNKTKEMKTKHFTLCFACALLVTHRKHKTQNTKHNTP